MIGKWIYVTVSAPVFEGVDVELEGFEDETLPLPSSARSLAGVEDSGGMALRSRPLTVVLLDGCRLDDGVGGSGCSSFCERVREDDVLSAGTVRLPRFRIKLMLLRPSLGLLASGPEAAGACTLVGDPIANVCATEMF
jgi:hypothetical protein